MLSLARRLDLSAELFSRKAGLILFPLLVLLPLAHNELRLRQIALFLISFSFLTNALGWLYLLAPDRFARLGTIAVRYLTFVTLVWGFFLHGKEAGRAEYIFNIALHYVQPAFVICFWTYSKKRDGNYWWIGWLFPTFYFLAMLLLTPVIGYPLYPVLTDNFSAIFLIYLISEFIIYVAN